MGSIKDGANYAPSSKVAPVIGRGEFQYAASFLDHGHIVGQCNGLRDAGATLKWVYDPDPERVARFCLKFPLVQVAKSFDEILQDPLVQLVTSAAVPNQRASEITRLNLMQTLLMRVFFAARGDCSSLGSRGGVSIKTLVWIAHLFRRVLSITRYQ